MTMARAHARTHLHLSHLQEAAPVRETASQVPTLLLEIELPACI